MKKIILVVVVLLLISGCSKESINYSFSQEGEDKRYVMELTEESLAEFETKNSNLLQDLDGTEKDELLKLSTPSLNFYAENSNIFPCHFEYGSIYNMSDMDECRYEISEEENPLTVYISCMGQDTEYAFEILDERTLKFVQEKSSELLYVEKNCISIPDGAIFRYEE